MIYFEGFDFKTNIFNNKVYANPGKKVHIEIHLKNKSTHNLSGYVVDIACPPESLVNKKRKRFGTVNRKSTKKHVYKLIFNQPGIYDIELFLIKEDLIVDSLPMKCYVGVSMPKIQDFEIQKKKKEIRSKINPDIPKFCRYCGSEIEIVDVFCSNCGTSLKEY